MSIAMDQERAAETDQTGSQRGLKSRDTIAYREARILAMQLIDVMESFIACLYDACLFNVCMMCVLCLFLDVCSLCCYWMCVFWCYGIAIFCFTVSL